MPPRTVLCRSWVVDEWEQSFTSVSVGRFSPYLAISGRHYASGASGGVRTVSVSGVSAPKPGLVGSQAKVRRAGSYSRLHFNAMANADSRGRIHHFSSRQAYLIVCFGEVLDFALSLPYSYWARGNEIFRWRSEECRPAMRASVYQDVEISASVNSAGRLSRVPVRSMRHPPQISNGPPQRPI